MDREGRLVGGWMLGSVLIPVDFSFGEGSLKMMQVRTDLDRLFNRAIDELLKGNLWNVSMLFEIDGFRLYCNLERLQTFDPALQSQFNQANLSPDHKATDKSIAELVAKLPPLSNVSEK